MENIEKENTITRRKFIKDASVLLGGVAAGSGLLLGGCGQSEVTKTIETTKVVEKPVLLDFPPSKGSISVDMDKCTGCQSCEVACSLYHFGVINPTLARIQIVKDWKAADSSMEVRFLPAVCRQCANAKCAAVCQTDAITFDPVTHARIVDESKCIGCGLCVAACPYTPARIKVNKANNKAFKCDLCGGDPTCVKVCSSGALSYQFSEEGVV